MSELKTYYRPGLRFRADKNAFAHQECCYKGAEEIRNADGTMQKEAIRPLWAEFGTFGPEVQRIGEDGEPINDMFDGTPLFTAQILGGWFDLDVQAEEKGWSDTEKEIVARHMLTLPLGVAQFRLAEDVKAAPPWPTYDATHHKQIPTLAGQLGLAAAALQYEQQNKKRPEVIEKLREQLAAPAPEVIVEDDDLVAA